MVIDGMYGKPFVPPLKGNVIGNGEVNRNGKQLCNGKCNAKPNGKQLIIAQIAEGFQY
jgi:hypothetical protein